MFVLYPSRLGQEIALPSSEKNVLRPAQLYK